MPTTEKESCPFFVPSRKKFMDGGQFDRDAYIVVMEEQRAKAHEASLFDQLPGDLQVILCVPVGGHCGDTVLGQLRDALLHLRSLYTGESIRRSLAITPATPAVDDGQTVTEAEVIALSAVYGDDRQRQRTRQGRRRTRQSTGGRRDD